MRYSFISLFVRGELTKNFPWKGGFRRIVNVPHNCDNCYIKFTDNLSKR